MKIARQIRDTYSSLKDVYNKLSIEVCAKLQPKVDEKSWFFTHRIKKLESYALKIETGRVPKPSQMDDFFACTIIVPTVSQIHDAEELVKQIYQCHKRRPPEDEHTHKRASSFVFDDLRLYMRHGSSSSGRNEDLRDKLFEVQIKTILQHAWSIASHDLIYKTDNVSWPKERIAYQVKAMLEHAEIAIAESGSLATSSAISKQDKDTKEALNIICTLRNFWPADELPHDIKRLAENFRDVMNLCDIDTDNLFTFLEEERQRLGTLPKNLSPYSFLVQAVAHSTKLRFEEKIRNSRNNRLKIFIHSDMELPKWMTNKHTNIIRL